MKKLPKIVVIGAGSASFGLSIIRDASTTKRLWGSELFLVDIDNDSLLRTVRMAERINREIRSDYQIRYSTDRREALRDTDFVITSVAIERNRLWKKDFEVPRKHGLKHILGENNGPGAVFHTLRNIPVMLEICADMEELCPEALLINFTNPESRMCLAIHKYTNVKAVGLCHQIGEGIRIIATILGRKAEDLDIKAAGLNHFTWVLSIRDRRTGEDLYPQFREREKDFDPEFEKLSRYLFHRFGLFPTSGDGHLGEFFPFAHELTSDAGYDFTADSIFRSDLHEFIDGIGSGRLSLETRFPFPGQGEIDVFTPSGEQELNIIQGIQFNTNSLIISANLPNRGLISNLPAMSIVEVPAIVSGSGLNGLSMGNLPDGIASLCSAQINVQNLVVDAGVRGDRTLVKQALLVDPNVPSAAAAEAVFEELFEVNEPYLPQFQNRRSD